MKSFLCFIAFAFGVTYCSTTFDDRLLELESFIEEQDATNADLKRRVINLADELATLNAEDTSQESVFISSLSDETTSDETTDQGPSDIPDTDIISKRASGNTIAFHAHRSTSRCYNDHETIVFDVEDVDTGGISYVGTYDKRDGIFEPPVSGVYAFTWTATAPTGSNSFVTELVIAGRVTGVITSDPDKSFHTGGITEPTAQRRTVAGSGLHPASAIVVTQVNAGDHCYIRVRQSSGTCTNVLSESDVVRTTFSGWRLF